MCGPRDPPGLAITDTTCNMCMHDRPCREKHEAALVELGQDATVKFFPGDRSVSGVGGATRSSQSALLPVGIFGNNGQIMSVEVEENIPMLMSRNMQKTLDVHHHMRDDKIDLLAIGVVGADVINSSHNHPCVSLLDFDGQHGCVRHKLLEDSGIWDSCQDSG